MASFAPRPRTGTDTRRRFERVEWTPDDRITVDLVRAGLEPLPACWADLSVSGVMLILPIEEEGESEYAIGRELELLFTLDQQQFHLRGEVVWAVEDESGKIMTTGVKFLSIDPEIEEQNAELWSYFTRRVTQRTYPREGEDIAVLARGAGMELSGRLVNISTSGLGLAFQAEEMDDARLAQGLGHEFELELKLTAELPTIRLCARADRSAKENGVLSWGLVFLEHESDGQEEALEVVNDFCRSRRDP